MAKKMKPELMALSAALILGVYGAGYALTTPTVSLGTPAAITSAGSASTPAGTPSARPASPVAYRDGIYNATGSSDLGTVTVGVTIRGGRISDVQITDWGMHYSQSDVDGLPAEVLAAQSAKIDWISGATYSSYSFDSAVAQALAQATTPSVAPTAVRGT